MSKNTTKTLFNLAKTDQFILLYSNQKREIVSRRDALIAKIEDLKAAFEKKQQVYESTSSKNELDSQRLQEEEQKIIERRKQLSALGGAKSAKLVEREIDIAGRSLKTLEEVVLVSLEDVEKLKAEADECKALLESQMLLLSSEHAEDDDKIKHFDDEISRNRKERENLITELDSRLAALYQKVSGRYPGDAVSIAKNGNCISCFRSLPAQTFNQILAGNTLITCPGCSRILVYDDSEDASKS